MDLSFYPLTLEALDQANAQGNAEALCLFIGADERPLVGLSGLCDWRLSGGLSRMLRGGLVKGEDGEALLTPGSTVLEISAREKPIYEFPGQGYLQNNPFEHRSRDRHAEQLERALSGISNPLPV